jgi:hypothetical protein
MEDAEAKPLAIDEPELGEKLEKQLVWQVFLPPEQVESGMLFFPAKLAVTHRGTPVGEAQIILSERWEVEDLTKYDAIVSGYDSLEEYLESLKRHFPKAKRIERAEGYKILFRWL